MKIQSVKANNRKQAFEVTTASGVFALPYSRVEPSPAADDPLAAVYVDDDLGREGFTYLLKSGAEGSAHVDAVLEYNEDPGLMRDLLVYQMTLEAQRCLASSSLSKREIIRRLGTSASQFYRLLDPTNTRKSVDKLLSLFAVLDCEVSFSVQPMCDSRAKPKTGSAIAIGYTAVR